MCYYLFNEHALKSAKEHVEREFFVFAEVEVKQNALVLNLFSRLCYELLQIVPEEPGFAALGSPSHKHKVARVGILAVNVPE